MVSPGQVDYELMLEMLLNFCHYWGLGCCCLFHLGTQLYLFCQNLQYSVIIDINTINTVIWVNMVGIILTTWVNQGVIGMDCTFVSVLLILNMEKFFISGILVAIACKSWL